MGDDSDSDRMGRLAPVMLDAIAQAVIALDLTGCVTYWNAAAERCFGWSAAEAMGQSADALMHPDLTDDEALAVFEQLAAGKTWSRESIVQRRDGTRFPALLANSGIYADNGELVGIIGVTTDLTELKRAEYARQDSEGRLQTVVDNCPVVLVAFDVTGTITLAEGRDLAAMGLHATGVVGTPLDILRIGVPAIAEAVEGALAGEPRDVELSLRDRRFDFRCWPKLDVTGNVVGVLAVGNDITERVAAAERLSRREARWHALVSQSADAALIADVTTTEITYASPAVTRLFGWQPEELHGTMGLALVHPQDVEHVTEVLKDLLDDPEGHATVEFRFKCSDGSYRWVEENLSNLADVPGVQGFVGNLRDISDRRAAEEAVRRRARRTRALAAKAADVALIVSLDGRVSYSNPSATAVLVAAEGDTLDTSRQSYVHPDDRAMVSDMMRGLAAPDATARMTYRRLGIDGTWRWVEHIVTNCANDPDIRGMVVNLREITEQVQAQHALRSSEARYRLIADTAQEGIWATDSEGQTLYANQKMADLLGCPISDIYAYRSDELVTGISRIDVVTRQLIRSRLVSETYELRHRRPDDSQRILRVSASPLVDDGQYLGSLAMISDITDAREGEAQLRHRATHDPLTGLANRDLLIKRVEKALARTAAEGAETVAVLVADLDQFKLVNDSLGHASGDDLLIEVARRWQGLLNPSQVLARLGGDEFVVVCDPATEREARHLADQLLGALDEPIMLSGRSVTINASVGIVVTSAGDEADAQTLLRYADAAMYSAKSQGRGRTAVFTACLADRARHRLDLFNDLKRALEQVQLELHYQPVVELATGRLLGVEALSRWTHPVRGSVSPSEFIAVAEERGLIEALDRWALRRACQDAAAMRADGILSPDAYVAVNVSAGHLAQPGFEQAVRTALSEAQLPPQRLVIEVTESAVMQDPAAAQEVLESLQALGVEVAIDDFGTGYSSLAYLRRFPVSSLKIDRRFVTQITESTDDRAIVTAVIDLANALNVRTTAEGIETAAGLELLQRLGCLAGQGFLWSPALPPERLAALLGSLSKGRFPIRPEREMSGQALPPPRSGGSVTSVG